MKKVVFTSVISLFLLLPITSYALTVKVLVVGGGGGGGAGRSAGGGGAGGCQYDANHDVSITSL